MDVPQASKGNLSHPAFVENFHLLPDFLIGRDYKIVSETKMAGNKKALVRV